MNIYNNIDIHNNFEVKVVNEEGCIMDEGYAENVVLDNLWFELSRRRGTYSDSSPERVGIGTGVATSDLEPSATSMINRLGRIVTGTDRNVKTELVNNVETTTITFTATIPATNEYEGEITEVSTFNGSTILSHALLKDSEGNPISITKTENDAMIINVTFYVVVNFNLDMVPVNNRSVIAKILSKTTSGAAGMDVVEVGLTSLNDTTTGNRTFLVESGAIQSRTPDVSDVKKLVYNKKRLPNTSGNNIGFANYISIKGLGSVKLPNSNYFPEYTIKNLDVGVGDGIENVFTCPVPEFIEGSDVIKVDGVPLVRGVDYQIDSTGNGRPEHLPSISKSAKTPHFLIGASTSVYPTFYNSGSRNPASRDMYLDFLKPINFRGVCLMDLKYAQSSIKVYAKNDINSEWVLIRDFSAGVDKVVNWIDLENEVKYRYWSLESTGARSFDTNNPNMPVWFGDKPSEGIRFTEPPAENAKITITCKVDRPFKSEDFIFDTSYKINY